MEWSLLPNNAISVLPSNPSGSSNVVISNPANSGLPTKPVVKGSDLATHFLVAMLWVTADLLTSFLESVATITPRDAILLVNVSFLFTRDPNPLPIPTRLSFLLLTIEQ